MARKSSPGVTELIQDQNRQGERFDYLYHKEKKQLVYYSLGNGMKLVLAVPSLETYSGANRLFVIILTAVLIALLFSGIVGIVVASNISRPIKQLTAVIDQTSRLDFRATEFGQRLRPLRQFHLSACGAAARTPWLENPASRSDQSRR